MKFSIVCFFILLFLMGSRSIVAQQLVYTPINPNFGGYYYNGTWMLAQAQAEKQFTVSSSSNPYSSSPLQTFQSSLNNAILSQLSQKIISQVFGENALKAGNYTFGNYAVNINPETDGIHIDIKDNSTGGQTSVIVPFY